MRELAASNEPGCIGCTQITEILYTPGVSLSASLPEEFELATVYTAAINSKAIKPETTQHLIDLITGPEAAAQRSAGGFEPIAG